MHRLTSARWQTGAVLPLMPGSRYLPRILPGICQRLAGSEDVMRGEETQLLGLSTLLPGFRRRVHARHASKWVRDERPARASALRPP